MRDLVPDVPPFVRDYAAGDMAMLALEAALKALGEERPAWWLAGVSGDAFKFLYDRAAVFEPLRDRVPVDTLTLACAAVGRLGHWVADEPVDAIKSLVQDAVRRGRPLLAPNLGEQYHGMVIVVGLDEEQDQFLLQVARLDLSAASDYVEVPVPSGWDGPVPGPLIWADNPIFVLQERASAPEQEATTRAALARALDLHDGNPLPYSGHPGAQEYSVPVLAERTVPQGLQALEALREDVGDAEISWPLIWRMDSQCGQMAYDRANAARFLRYVAQGHPAQGVLSRAADSYADTAATAAELQRSYWDKRWREESDRETVRDGVAASSSFVHDVAGLSEPDLVWLRRRIPMLDTAWGPAAVWDGGRRRRYNLALVDRIIQNEVRCVEALRQAQSQ